MCIVIDANVIANVLDVNSQNHQEFEPIFNWLINGKGKLVYGGTKYEKEIGKYLNIFKVLKDAQKAKYIDNTEVDKLANIVAQQIQHKDFDDQHLVALLLQSGCKLICSHDERAYPFFRSSTFFSPSSAKPKIYRGLRNKDLLSDKNIADVCKPCSNTTNEQKRLLPFFNNKK